MKLGETINGYRVITAPTNDGGGKCVYAFAELDGQEYFLKQFLDPKWPLDSSPGNERSKAIRRKACEAFEARHRHVMERLKNGRAPGGGNIVVAEDFFRDGSTYYKVTERIDVENLSNLTTMSTTQQAVVLRTLGLSVQQLHRIGVVHGDLKPANILVQRRPGNDLYTAKLIDFDDSYLAGQAPGRDLAAGSPEYGAPEWLRYIGNDESVGSADLTAAVDMFALGLILHEYLTGECVGFATDRFDVPGTAVAAGATLDPSPRLGLYLQGLIKALTSAEPKLRPNIDEFLKALEDETVLDPRAGAATRPYPAKEPSGSGSGPRASVPSARRWKHNTGPASRTSPDSETAPVRPVAPAPTHPEKKPAEPPTRASRVRIRMTKSTAEPAIDNPEKGE